MTKNKIDIHKLGQLILPACVLVISIGFGLAISVYGQISADTESSLTQCISSVRSACKELGYDEKCSGSSVEEDLSKLVSSAETDATCEGADCSTEKALAAKVNECQSTLIKAKKMAKASTAESAQTTGDESDFSYMSNQSFSATTITSADSDSKCKGTKKGQIILVSNIKAGSGSVQSSFYNSLDWTKRGKVFGISTEVKTSIITKLKKENKLETVFGTVDEKIIELNLISGSVFYDVPLNQNLSGLVYSSSWSGKSIAIPSFAGPKSECESVFIAVNYQEAGKNLTDKYKICVHSPDKAKDYKDKKTFIYPDDKTDAEAYKLADKDRIISLGPCQTDETSGGGSSGTTGDSSSASNQSLGNSGLGIGSADVSSSGSGTVSSSSSSTEGDTQIALKRLNEFRKEQGKPDLVVDSAFQSFADFRAKYFQTLTFSDVASAGGHPLYEQHSSEKNFFPVEEIAIQTGSGCDWISQAENLINSKDGHREGLIDSSGKIGIVATSLKDGCVLVVELSGK